MSEWFTGGHGARCAKVIRAREQIVPAGWESRLIDTNAAPLAVDAVGNQTVTYEVLDPATGAMTAAYSLAANQSVTLPAGKILRVCSTGAFVLDPSPSSWPAAGPLG